MGWGRGVRVTSGTHVAVGDGWVGAAVGPGVSSKAAGGGRALVSAGAAAPPVGDPQAASASMIRTIAYRGRQSRIVPAFMRGLYHRPGELACEAIATEKSKASKTLDF